MRGSMGKKGAYSSPIFSMLNNPQSVPTSLSCRSSGRLTMVAPTASAIRLLSLLRTRRRAETLLRSRIYCAVSTYIFCHYYSEEGKKERCSPETPFSVMTRSGLNSKILFTKIFTCSSSISCARLQSLSFENSIFV